MTRFSTSSIRIVVAAGLALAAGPAFPQTKPVATKETAKQKPAEATKASEKPREPATVEEAERVLDLRTFPVMEGAKIYASHRTLGTLLYNAKGTPQEACEFQRKQLLKLGFKELPGGYTSPSTCTAFFTKDGFQVTAGASEVTSNPEQEGWSSVSVVNDGNVDLRKLPTPPGVKDFRLGAFEAAYTTEGSVADTAAACSKLLIDAGWEPYGQAGSNPMTPDSQMHYFKKSAIKLLSWVSTTQAEGNKTLIRYSTELLSANLPAPPEAADPRYTDFQKTLMFESPADRSEAIIAFYQERLPKQGWKATTERPIVDQKRKTQFLVFRNAKKDMLSLDLFEYSDLVRTELKHQTAAELEAAEKRAEEEAKLAEEKLAKENRKINVPVPLPPRADKLEQEAPNLVEFTLPKGNGKAGLTALRDHFVKAGWTEEKDDDWDDTTGRTSLKKDNVRIGLSYFDIGTADIRISGPKNVVFEPHASGDKPATEKKRADVAKPAKKPRSSAIPGLPELPPGVELPDDVKKLLDEALDEAEAAQPPPAKKPAPKKPAPRR